MIANIYINILILPKQVVSGIL